MKKFDVEITVTAESRKEAQEMLVAFKKITSVISPEQFIEVGNLIYEKPIIVDIAVDIGNRENLTVAQMTKMLPGIVKKIAKQ